MSIKAKSQESKQRLKALQKINIQEQMVQRDQRIKVNLFHRGLNF